MIRPLTIACLVAAGSAGMHLYSVKHHGMVLDRELRDVRKSTEQVRDRTQVLRAEWAMLNEPARLRDATTRHLPLEPMQPQQFLRMAEVDHRLPATVSFAGAPSLFAPKIVPAAPAAPVMVASLPATVPAAAPAPARPTEAAAPVRPARSEAVTLAARQPVERAPDPRPAELRLAPEIQTPPRAQRLAALVPATKPVAARSLAPVARPQPPALPAAPPLALSAPPPRARPTLVAAAVPAAPHPQASAGGVGEVISRAAQGVSATFSAPVMASALGALTTNLAPPVPFRSAVAATLDNSGRSVR